jgi:hypothetical protein
MRGPPPGKQIIPNVVGFDEIRHRRDVAFPTVEKNSTIIFPAQFMTTVQEAIALLSKDSASKKLRNIFSHRTLGFTCPYSKTPKR